MEYENFHFKDKDVVMSSLSSGEQNKIVSAIVGAINGIEDNVWLEDMCLSYIHHKSYWVAKTALTGLGDIARIYKTLNLQKIHYEISQISDEALTSVINDLKADLEIFVKK